MSLILHHWCAWAIFADHSALVVNWRGHFAGVVDTSGLLHRLVSW